MWQYAVSVTVSLLYSRIIYIFKRMILNGYIWKALLKLKPTFSSNRPAILANGMWDQVRVDHGKEFYLTLFIQELLSPHRYTQERRPYLQTPSTRVQFSMFYSCCTNTHCGYPCWNYLLICVIVYLKTIICFNSSLIFQNCNAFQHTYCREVCKM